MSLKCARCLLDAPVGTPLATVAEAVTQITGTAVCRPHAEETADAPGAMRDPVLRARAMQARLARRGRTAPQG